MATWNILATAYIRRSYYPNTPEQFLNAVWREPAVTRHAAALAMDILCLQEVEREVYDALHTELTRLGYQGAYARKVGNRPDGCATFVKSDRFQLVEERRVVYRDGGGGPNSGHIAQVLVLEEAGRRLAILNTHLKWHPPGTPATEQWGHRQITQAMQELGAADGHILCGDFNVLPDSDVVRALMAGGFDYAHRSSTGIASCITGGETKLIDFLFHGSSLRATPIPPMALDRQTILPSPECPSDHVPLAAEFEWV